MTTPRSSALTRRAVMAGAAGLAALPLGAGAAVAAGSAAAGADTSTPIRALWAEAQALETRMAAYRAEIAASASSGGIPGWMRLGGEANRLGERRYGTLAAILNEEPRDAGDLAVLAKVYRDEDIQNGGKAWAAERLAEAALKVFAA